MNRSSEWSLYLSECIGTALLLSIGLSIVIFNWGQGSIIAQWIPSPGVRRLITGFLFGSTGCIITLSPVGKISGAHINPAMSVAFWLRGKMKTRALMGYIVAQMTGAAIGSLPLLLWNRQGSSVGYGITLPGSRGITAAFWGEFITTAIFIVVIFVFVGSRKLRDYTAFTVPPMFCLMVWAESPLSGCSTNPARSFGPALISYDFTSFWIYIAAPVSAAFVVAVAFRLLNLHRKLPVKNAKLSYHDAPTQNSITTGDVISQSPEEKMETGKAG